NYGEEYARKLGLKGAIVKISNYLGDVLLYSVEKGFKNITIVGHIGKMCKVSIGAFNTSSRVVDSRMEAFVYYLAKLGYPYDIIVKVENFKTAEEAAEYLMDSGYFDVLEEMRKGIIERLKRYLKKDDINLEVHLYTFGMLR
ncbi:MAG: cobalt-precorrin-5B (C(1))-methyltransferase, partial [Candidatus Nanoarchaeia archaeon]|nr:cobalt-precorrin-5B (C(1))-methyltransferase [Candidatus Jingweiarchaeum tengchongense]